ncbi:DNA polymerase III, epsilon subunit [Alteracholeplasma palmae J233]|uniref:DNA polymerase III, epsilon subunit n=1 Tax=Alteracholeplasma palmae (strain ATCC 49389 / J233) TaxID=1318466 RepID=U4KRM0_ALTPJ|nr:3'-5' exonuclease [Alteracholeplasma palmae]CCV64286.1 DNA polymerase III, epsilon subunit [Alteracholeplasma palmae J233]
MLKNNKVLIFDFETSGLSPQDSQVIEIGAVLLEEKNNTYVVSKELNLLVTADKPLPAKIVEITNITDEMLLRDGVEPKEAFRQLSSMIDEQTLLVAYNIQFDLSFLQKMYQDFYEPSYKIKNDILDVMVVYKDRNEFPHRLENAVAKYKVSVLSTHRALDDVYATYEVLKALKAEKPVIKHYVNKIGYNPKYGVSGIKLPHVTYIPQYGNRLEVEKA